jgi:hypothetical protein
MCLQEVRSKEESLRVLDREFESLRALEFESLRY